jgi:hypothetical protein
VSEGLRSSKMVLLHIMFYFGWLLQILQTLTVGWCSERKDFAVSGTCTGLDPKDATILKSVSYSTDDSSQEQDKKNT